MAKDPKYAHKPPKNDDGSYKEVLGQFGFWYVLPDGHTIENVLTGDQYDLSNIGGGTDTDTHVDITEGGNVVTSDPDSFEAGTNITATDNGDGTTTLSSPDTKIRTREAQIVPTTISDGSSAPGVWKRVPSGKTLKLLEAGVQDSAQSAPTGLTIEVYDLTNATTIMSKNALHVEGSPIASKSGAIDVEFRVANATGGSVDGSGYTLYTME